MSSRKLSEAQLVQIIARIVREILYSDTAGDADLDAQLVNGGEGIHVKNEAAVLDESIGGGDDLFEVSSIASTATLAQLWQTIAARSSQMVIDRAMQVVSLTESSSAPSVESPGLTTNNQYSCYVGNMPWWTTDSDLADSLASAGLGDLIDIKFYENRDNGQSKGFAAVAFSNEAAMRQCMEKIAGRQLHGQRLVALPYNKTSLSQLEAASRSPIVLPPPRMPPTLIGPPMSTPGTNSDSETTMVEEFSFDVDHCLAIDQPPVAVYAKPPSVHPNRRRSVSAERKTLRRPEALAKISIPQILTDSKDILSHQIPEHIDVALSPLPQLDASHSSEQSFFRMRASTVGSTEMPSYMACGPTVMHSPVKSRANSIPHTMVDASRASPVESVSSTSESSSSPVWVPRRSAIITTASQTPAQNRKQQEKRTPVEARQDDDKKRRHMVQDTLHGIQTKSRCSKKQIPHRRSRSRSRSRERYEYSPRQKRINSSDVPEKSLPPRTHRH